MTHAARSGRGISFLNSSVLYRGIGACLAVLVAAAAWAQAPVGTISGTVRDQSDAIIPQASITVRHIATGAERHLLSGMDGTFSAPSLAPGNMPWSPNSPASALRKSTSPSRPVGW